MFHAATLNIKFEVSDLVRTIDFYNILLGESVADLYEGHAIYALRKQALTITFVENPKVTEPLCGNFSFVFNSDNDVYERFTQFTRAGFARTLKADYDCFGPENHSFGIKDPNGLFWKLNVKEKETSTFKLFNIPRVNSVWDILKPL
jgi:uncharacterized glyoxalase superfamily protein PhnB